MKKINKYNLIYFCFFITISLITLKMTYTTNNIKIYGILIIILLIVSLIIWILKYKKINVPILYLLIISYICWFGEIIIKTLDLKYTGNLVIDNNINYQMLKQTIFYSITGYGMFFCGALIATKKNKLINNYDEIQEKSLKKAITIVAIIMIIIGMPQFFWKLVNRIQISFSDSYMAIYESKNATPIENITSSLGMFFIPGIILLMISNKKNKKIIYICLSIIIVNLILSFLSGARGQALGLIITAFWIYTTQIKKISLKKGIPILIVGIVILELFNVVAVFRVKKEKTIDTFIESLEDVSQNSVITSTMKEMGGNIFSLYHTIKLIPEYKDYSYGYTYFASVMAIVPSAFMGGHSFSDNAALAGWLMKTLDLNYGPGYTILAESYYNFGIIGIVAMLSIGIIYSKILQCNKQDKEKKILEGAIIGIGMYTCILTFRGTMLLVFRNYFYTIIIPIIVINIIKNTLKKKGI